MHGRLAGPALYPVEARQHALDVAVEDGGALAQGDAGDGPGGGAADAGQLFQALDRVRKLSTEFEGHHFRGPVQVARPGVVAKAGPEVQHFILRRLRQRRNVRKRRHKALEVGNHCLHLSLLEHYLRYPHTVRVDPLLPRQVVASVDVEPVENAQVEVGCWKHVPG